MFKISANQISDNIDINSFKEAYNAELLYSNQFELFYEVDTELYVSVFRYGVVCFFNYEELKASELIRKISDYCLFFYDSELNKEYQIETNAIELKFGYNKAELTYFDIDTLRVIMLNVAQSVALDYYFQKSRIMLNETNQYTFILESTGKLTISNKRLKKIVGQINTIKNEIVENLQIFNLIQETTENTYLIQIDLELKKGMFIRRRMHCVREEIQNINEHLEYFSTILDHSDFMKSEWIWTALLAIFALDIIIRDILHELFMYLKN